MRDVLRMNILIKFTTSWLPGMQSYGFYQCVPVRQQEFVNLFIAIGLKNKWASRNSALLQVAVDEDQVLTSHVCTKCTLGLVALAS